MSLGAEIDALVDDSYLAASATAEAYVRHLAVDILARIEREERAPGGAPELRFAHEWLVDEARGDRTAALPERPQLAAAIGSSLEMFDYVAGLYPDYLQGERSGPAILLKGPALRLWEDYFGPANPLYDIHNQLGWIGLREAARRLGRPAHILELGAGTGGGTEAILRGLQQEGAASAASLTVSDISPTFLIHTLERLAQTLAPLPVPVQRKKLDFTRPLAEQGIAPGSVDVLLGVNALHNGTDLVASLRALRPTLADDGYLIVSESLCPAGGHVHQDFVFNLLPLERRAHSAAASRFLQAGPWAEILREGGFTAEVARNSHGPELALLAIARP